MSAFLFAFEDYRDFLTSRLEELGRGASRRLAQHLGCQSSYLSRVLKGSADFSLEQALGSTEFLRLSAEEKKYFLLLVQCARAATSSLKEFFENEIKALKASHNVLSKRIPPAARWSEKTASLYYSDLSYTLVHAAHIVHQRHPKNKIPLMGLSATRFHEIAEQLRNMGVLKDENGKLVPAHLRTHLGPESPYLPVHHTHWRLKSIQHIQEDLRKGLHYSSVIVISRNLAEEIREKLIDSIREIKNDVKDSSEDELHAFCLDFFPLL